MDNVAGAVADPRSTDRYRVLMAGTLFTPEGAQSVRIRDISRTGALIATEARAPAGCDSIFKRGKLFAAARVAWSNDKEAGLEFYRELSAGDIELS